MTFREGSSNQSDLALLPRHAASPLCWAAGRGSGCLFVAGYVGYVELGGLVRGVDPSGVAVTGDVDADDRAEGVRVDAVVAVTHDGLVDVTGDDQGQRVSCGAERLLYAWSVEQAEGDVECFAEASVAVVVDFSGVHHDADAELASMSQPRRVWLLPVLAPVFDLHVRLASGAGRRGCPGCPVPRRLRPRRGGPPSVPLGWLMIVSWVRGGRKATASR